jgi:hypothetical protein
MQKNVNLDVINKKGETPLHLAIQRNNVTIIKLLLHLGASTKAINFEGNTPMEMLEERNMSYMVKRQGLESVSIHSSGSKMRASSKGMIEIEIQEAKDKTVEDMFSNMRNYFGENGHLKPKNNSETIEMSSSSV